MSTEAELIELSKSSFWDARYAAETSNKEGDGEETIESFEWFRDFHKLKPFFTKWLPDHEKEGLVLHLGCGNSTLPADLHALGYTHQISVDFSAVVIEAMRVKYRELGLRWEIMDVRSLGLGDGSVDVAVDKGTLDAFIHGSLWDPPEDVRRNVGAYVDQVARVLRPGGKWLYITYRQPHFMKPLLIREEKWSVEVEVLEDPDGAGGFEYFGFVMTRHLDPRE